MGDIKAITECDGETGYQEFISDITQFTRGPLSGNNGCTFVDGPIKTGAAAGFDESTWFDECYIPMAD